MLIRGEARRAPLLTGPENYRTSSTCNLGALSNGLVRYVEQRIADELDLDPRQGEGLAGQVYLSGEYYRAHHDSFHEGTEEYRRFVRNAGNRIWSAMIYLNTVNQGGETRFPGLGLVITPKAGELVAWCNLNGQWIPDERFIHSAEPAGDQPKYVVTQWFRERPLR
jgi:prolyl 4-hydroxylase